MADISGFGSIVTLKASITFPTGLPLTQFADDSDPFDIPELQIGDAAKGVNGDLVTWKKAMPIPITIGLVPNSTNDQEMSLLLMRNTPVRNQAVIKDIITISVVYPDQGTLTLTNGSMTHGMPGLSIASAGRFKSKTYKFTFESAIFVPTNI